MLASLFTWWPYGVVGAIVALFALRAWIRDARRDYARLPRHQRVATAVIPAVRSGAPPSALATGLGRACSASGEVVLDVAPSEVQTRTMSRIESTPTSSPPLDDHQVADVAARHLDRGALEAPVGRGGDHRVGHVVADALGVRVLARGRAS